MRTRMSIAALALVVALPAQAQETVPASAATAAAASPAAAVATPVLAVTPAEDGSPAMPERVADVLAVGDSANAPSGLRENSYFYSAFGTTDPFSSLLAGSFDSKKQEIVDVHTVQLVGVIWEPDEIAAMVQDAQGYGYTLRPGDVVKNGTIVAIKRDALVARLNIFGQTTQVTLHLQRDDEE